MFQDKRWLHVILGIDLIIVLPLIIWRGLVNILSIVLLLNLLLLIGLLLLLHVIHFLLLDIHIIFRWGTFLFRLLHLLRHRDLSRVHNVRIVLLLVRLLVGIRNVLLILIPHLSHDYILDIVIYAQIDGRFHITLILTLIQSICALLLLSLLLVLFLWMSTIFARWHSIVIHGHVLTI